MIVKCNADTCKHCNSGICLATVIELENVEFEYGKCKSVDSDKEYQNEQFCKSYESELM